MLYGSWVSSKAGRAKQMAVGRIKFENTVLRLLCSAVDIFVAHGLPELTALCMACTAQCTVCSQSLKSLVPCRV